MPKTQYVTADTPSAEVQELRKTVNALLTVIASMTGANDFDDLNDAINADGSGVNKIAVDPAGHEVPVGRLV